VFFQVNSDCIFENKLSKWLRIIWKHLLSIPIQNLLRSCWFIQFVYFHKVFFVFFSSGECFSSGKGLLTELITYHCRPREVHNRFFVKLHELLISSYVFSYPYAHTSYSIYYSTVSCGYCCNWPLLHEKNRKCCIGRKMSNSFPTFKFDDHPEFVLGCQFVKVQFV
jgi:hypothetical protein